MYVVGQAWHDVLETRKEERKACMLLKLEHFLLLNRQKIHFLIKKQNINSLLVFSLR